MNGREGIFGRFRQPEYTGDNRCFPCTVLNVVIAAVGATFLAGVGIVAGIGDRPAVLTSAAAFALFLLVIYVRGYLIPGTPTLTRRYFPGWLLSAFGKDETSRPTVEAVDGEELLGVLAAADVLTDEGADARLTDSFRASWHDSITEPTGSDSVGSILDASDVRELGDTSFEVDGEGIERWVSTAALAADAAVTPALRSRIDGWSELDRQNRRDTLRRLRLLLDQCPACEGPLTTTTERLEHCCRRPHIAVRSECSDCGSIIADHVVPRKEADAWIELVSPDSSEQIELPTDR